MKKSLIWIASFCAFALAANAERSITKKVGDITFKWTFEGGGAIGEFVNGDPWVVGPITITSISPSDPNPNGGEDLHGTTVDIKPDEQGWSTHTSNIAKSYKSELNISKQLPYRVSPTKPVVTLYSDTSGDQGFESGAILTVVDAPVATGTFRPPYMGNAGQWRNWKLSSLNYNAFRRLSRTSSVRKPTDEQLIRSVGYLFIDMREGGGQGNTNMKIVGSGGGADYGRNVARASNDAMMSLISDYSDADKEKLMIAVVQRGIDSYGGVLAGYRAAPDGGHNLGRKVLFLAAAAALNDADMLAKLDSQKFPNFQEDRYFIRVGRAHVDAKHFRGEADYTRAMEGMPDWADDSERRVNRASPDWAYTGYRYMNGSGATGLVLCARAMGLADKLNHPIMFQYIEDRFFNIMDGRPEDAAKAGWPRVPNDAAGSIPSIGSTNSINRSVYEMWRTHHSELISGNSTPAPTPAPNVQRVRTPVLQPEQGSFFQRQSVAISSGTPNAVIHYTTDGSVPTSSSPIYNAPISVTATTTIRTFAVAENLEDSFVTTARYAFNSYESDTSWQTLDIPERNGRFGATWKMTASGSNIDAVAGLSARNTVTGYRDLAMIVRFSRDGFIDARNGNRYQADKAVRYEPGAEYEVSIEADMDNKVYDVLVKLPTGELVKIASDYAFRTEQAGISEITSLAFVSLDGSFSTLSEIQFANRRPKPPTGFRVTD